jgi:glycosyltransferase involved in cell wall biosynthesis
MVSVIIPAYNYGRFIAETVESLLSQTYRDFECIIIDNGSTDETQEVLKKIVDKRIVCIRQENKGVSHARNAGLKMAKGEYVLFLDADDLVENRKLEESVNFLEQHPGVDLVYSDMRYFKDGNSRELFYDYFCDPTGKRWMPYISGSGRDVLARILQGNIMVICAPVLRMQVIRDCGMFDEELLANEDWELWLRIIASEKNIQYFDSPATKALVRIHPTSLSKDFFKMQVFGLKVLLKNSEKIMAAGLGNELSTRIDQHVKLLNHTLGKDNRQQFTLHISELRRLGLLAYFCDDESNLGWLRMKLKVKSIIGN